MTCKLYKNASLLLLFACFSFMSTVNAQRYLAETFSTFSVEDTVYGQNITVLTGSPVLQDLEMTVYTPDGDTETDRPVVLYFHTGSFLPQYINGQITGSRTDSTTRYICELLAKMGYVAIAATYRQGWNPAAVGDGTPDGNAEAQDIRTGTLLQAAYRGIQDARTCVRFLRKTVDNGNPYGIDPDKIVMWGQGTGGYLSLGSAYLDDFEEILLNKFFDRNIVPYVDTTVLGNIWGTTEKPLCNPNHPEYSSDFALAINMGGALGDISWIDGTANEPPTLGTHVIRDPFAPYAEGDVIVPTTREFVVRVVGTWSVVNEANQNGTNDVFDCINDLNDPITQKIKFLSTVPLDYLGQQITVAVNNMYPFITEGLESGPWDWWDKPTLDATIDFLNDQGFDFNSDTLHNNGLLTNPDMSADKAKAHIDTIFSVFAPRMCAALGLESCLDALGADCGGTSTTNLSATEVGLSTLPNPAASFVIFETSNEPMRGIDLYDLSGRLLQSIDDLDTYRHELTRDGLQPGMYIARLHFDKGVVAQKVIFN